MNNILNVRKDSGLFPGPFGSTTRPRRLTSQEIIDARIGAAMLLVAQLSPTPIIEGTATVVSETTLVPPFIAVLPVPTEKPFSMDTGPAAEVVPSEPPTAEAIALEEVAPAKKKRKKTKGKRGGKKTPTKKASSRLLPRRYYRKSYTYVGKSGKTVSVPGKWNCPAYRGYVRDKDRLCDPDFRCLGPNDIRDVA